MIIMPFMYALIDNFKSNMGLGWTKPFFLNIQNFVDNYQPGYGAINGR
jgi:hypothetical protein